jgi:small subunit ribosomal protein S21
MIEVKIDYKNCNTKEQKDMQLERALKKFKKKLKKSEILLEVQQRQQYRKPSAVKREKKIKSILRNKYKVEKENAANK